MRTIYPVLLTAMLSIPALANVISLDQTIYNTNFTTSALGLRDVGAGNISVSGISGTVTKSLLYWHGPTNSTDPNVNANVSVAASPVSGTNIGFSQDNFWGSLNSQAYRADVTSLITGNDSNFSSSYDSAGWNFTLSGINYSGGSAFLTLYVSDGQNFSSADDGTLRINGNALASGGLFQGLSPRAAGAGVSNGSLTDIVTFDITSFLSPGVNSLNVTLDDGFNDALSAVVAAVDLPAGAAPVTTPEPASWLLMGSGILLAGLRRRFRS